MSSFSRFWASRQSVVSSDLPKPLPVNEEVCVPRFTALYE